MCSARDERHDGRHPPYDAVIPSAAADPYSHSMLFSTGFLITLWWKIRRLSSDSSSENAAG
jgi:hypothetical protein